MISDIDEAYYWQQKREAINHLIRELQAKPAKYMMGYQISPGGILNAYREGDITFDDACKLLEVKEQ